MLALLRAPVKIRIGMPVGWIGVAVLLVVETSSQCTWAQQQEPQSSDLEALAAAEVEQAEAEAEAEEQARRDALAAEECQRLVAVAIGRVPKPKIFPEVLDRRTTENTRIKVSLDKKLLEVFVAGKVALACPIACGRAGMTTETGDFKVISSGERAPAECGYGSLVDARGNLLLKGVYADLDSVPAGASFVKSPPNVYIVLSDEVVIHSGDANATASTNGAIVVPTVVGRTLLKVVTAGTQVIIE